MERDNRKLKRAQKRLRNRVNKAIYGYGLIADGDRVLIAVSGGQDSLVLLDILSDIRRSLPFTFSLEAIHIVVEDIPFRSDVQYIEQFCSTLNIPLHTVNIPEGKVQKVRNSFCFPCSWNKRKAIFQWADEKEFSKIAFGHHMDDALETMLMNMVTHGEFSTITPKLSMFEGRFEVIRPLMLCVDEEVKEYARVMEIRSAENECPHEEKNRRSIYREIVGRLGNIRKYGKQNMYRSMTNINMDYLPEKLDD